jgi:hypothetical protein
LTKSGGGAFDLISIDLAELNLPSFGGGVADVTFITNLGHAQAFSLDAVLGVETFAFDANFLGVTSVSWELLSNLVFNKLIQAAT